MIESELPGGAREALQDLKAARGACPSADALVGYEALSADDRARAPAHAHIQICSKCQLVLLHLAEPGTSSASSASSVPWKWALPVAAVAVLAVGFTVFTSRQAPPIDSVRGTELQPIGPAGTILGPPTFRWQSPLQGVTYRIIVRRGSTIVWMGRAETTEISAPESITFEPGAEYTWQVEAIDREGEVRMSSPLQSFTIS